MAAATSRRYTVQCGRFRIERDRPLIMAIINLTPDSFSGDGLFGRSPEAILALGQAAVDAGADILDIGGESSRPGAQPVSEKEELARVLPALETLSKLNVPLSVDTTKPAVMAAAISAGAAIINDIMGFQTPGAIGAVAEHPVSLCVMHMKGEPRTMQSHPHYDNVTHEIRHFFETRLALLQAAGIPANRVILDPGFGFGKTLEHNLTLLRELPALRIQNLPILVGISRKSMLGALTGQPVNHRLPASLAAALIAAERGAQIIRVHDVQATNDALRVWEAV